MQSGEDESKGVEFDINYSPVNNWQLYASYSHNDAKVKNDEQAPGRVGLRLQNSIPDAVNLWTRYNFTKGALENVFIGGGFNYIGGQVFIDDNPAARDYPTYTYTLISAMAGYNFHAAGHPMTLTLNGSNLANKFYRTASQGNGRPRQIQLTLRTTF